MRISLMVYGEPMTKGSKTAIVRAGRARLIEGGSGARRGLMRKWAQAVQDAAVYHKLAQANWEPYDGPIGLQVHFWLPRPKTQSKAQRLKVYAPNRVDLDKLVRAVSDPLQGILFTNDSRIVILSAMKYWLPVDDELGLRAQITIYSVADPP